LLDQPVDVVIGQARSDDPASVTRAGRGQLVRVNRNRDAIITPLRPLAKWGGRYANEDEEQDASGDL
jgi:hypothetical protein